MSRLGVNGGDDGLHTSSLLMVPQTRHGAAICRPNTPDDRGENPGLGLLGATLQALCSRHRATLYKNSSEGGAGDVDRTKKTQEDLVMSLLESRAGL